MPFPADTGAPFPADTRVPFPADTGVPFPAETGVPFPAETGVPFPADTRAFCGGAKNANTEAVCGRYLLPKYGIMAG